MVKRFWLIRIKSMTLHSPRNSLAVLNHKILEANSQSVSVTGGQQTCLSINRLWHELRDMLRRLLVEPQLLDIMIVQFRNEKVSNRAWSIRSPLIVTLWPHRFLKKDCGFHQPIKRTQTVSFSG
ncbi:hypothetical protein TNCV_1265661 [Trichonephila clavipes]|nr:hypothetical protein TNCV_1265661 [Trichonephila clavipes]